MPQGVGRYSGRSGSARTPPASRWQLRTDVAMSTRQPLSEAFEQPVGRLPGQIGRSGQPGKLGCPENTATESRWYRQLYPVAQLQCGGEGARGGRMTQLGHRTAGPEVGLGALPIGDAWCPDRHAGEKAPQRRRDLTAAEFGPALAKQVEVRRSASG